MPTKKTAQYFKALADETRLQMIWLLFNRRELCVCDFVEVLQTSQSKASRHLRNLYHAGLVDDRRNGLWVNYSLKPLREQPFPEQYKALKKTLGEADEAQVLLDRLDDWLERKAKGASCAIAANG
jgi:ArsR family transcriptional regulator, arsenate/arsenite/antimonite-responsive transcriptional repressor